MDLLVLENSLYLSFINCFFCVFIIFFQIVSSSAEFSYDLGELYFSFMFRKYGVFFIEINDIKVDGQNIFHDLVVEIPP